MVKELGVSKSTIYFKINLISKKSRKLTKPFLSFSLFKGTQKQYRKYINKMEASLNTSMIYHKKDNGVKNFFDKGKIFACGKFS